MLNFQPFFHGRVACLFVAAALADGGALGLAQEQVDKADRREGGAAPQGRMTVRVRATRTVPPRDKVSIVWRRGGEGLGGEVVRGEFTAEDGTKEIAAGGWSAWLPLETIVARVRGWEFPTVVVSPPIQPGRKNPKAAEPFTEVAVEFEFAEDGKILKAFREAAPKGATVGFAFPGGALGDRGAAAPEFIAQLQGLSGYARARRERLERLFPGKDPRPEHFAVLGHLGGYGEGPAAGKGGSSGFGVRHCNPEILVDECRTLRLLGINGLVGSQRLVEVAGTAGEFRRMYWGGPGSGSPMSFFQKGKNAEAELGCPFDPALKPHIAARIDQAIQEHRAAGARESWALWDDEIGVYVKEHLNDCARCRDAFAEYARSQGAQPGAFGKKDWDEVKPFRLWEPSPATGAKGKPGSALAAAPGMRPEALLYYYTFRFMTYATGQVYPEVARRLKEAGIPLYAMQGPTPSWGGASLDWHEFYDLGANTAMVFETSNRDPQVWQWESYLSDIARGIATRHGLPIGCLVKPHRGAPEQRMLSVVSRGAKAIEWYTYGPDYAKGDSFSQSPELLERVAGAGRLLGRGEEWLYGARWAGRPEVAFVSPRSSEIWGKATELGGTAFEDAKWVYLALAHAHVPMDVLSEQQLAEGKLSQYKVLYIVGPNLRRDAGVKVQEWVHGGGVLWTDALGLSRDEANQPATALYGMLGRGDRQLQKWGNVDSYRAAGLKPLSEPAMPAYATLAWETGGEWRAGKVRAAIGRESLAGRDGEIIARFADGAPALIRQHHGRGEVITAGLWAGLTYSARVRRADFDMRADFDPAARALIVAPALARKVYRPVVPSEPLVEAVLLDKAGRRSIALMNWSYRHGEGQADRRPRELQPAEKLRLELPGVAELKSVRSLAHGNLALHGEGSGRSVVLPKLAEIDLLILE